MHRIQYRIGVIWGTVAILLMTMAPAFAGGVSAIPATVDIPDVLRGSTIFKGLTLTNDTGVAIPFSIATEGPAAPWISIVDPDDRETRLTEVLDDGTGTDVLIRIDVPVDTANGSYDGAITAILEPPETKEGVGVGVGLGVRILISLDVAGVQVIDAALSDISISDTEAGVPARLLTSIDNLGNISVVPEFTVEILRGENVISKTTTASQSSYPGEEAVFEVLWDTSNTEPGDYTARVSVDFAGLDLGTEELAFIVYPAGTLNREVVLTSLEIDSEPWAGALAGITATVENPGQVDVSSTVVGELTKEGTLVSTYESQPFLVTPGQVVPIPIAIAIPDEGNYVFTARVRYGNAETNGLTVDFTAVPPPSATAEETQTANSATDGGVSTAGIAIGVAVFALLIGVLAWLMMRKRKVSHPTDQPPDEDIDPDKQAATVGSKE